MQNLNSIVKIFAKRSGRPLEVSEASEKNGALVLLGEKENTRNKSWKLIPVSVSDSNPNEFYRIVCCETGKALDVILGGNQDGAWVHQWEFVEVDSQLWQLEKIENNTYKIKSKLSGKCLDVVPEDNLHIQIWEDKDVENQKWIIEEQKLDLKEEPAEEPVSQEVVTNNSNSKQRQAAKKSKTATRARNTKKA